MIQVSEVETIIGIIFSASSTKAFSQSDLPTALSAPLQQIRGRVNSIDIIDKLYVIAEIFDELDSADRRVAP